MSNGIDRARAEQRIQQAIKDNEAQAKKAENLVRHLAKLLVARGVLTESDIFTLDTVRG